MLPKILKNFNAFVDGRGYAGRIDEISLPKLSIKTEEHRAGGMDIPVAMVMYPDILARDFNTPGLDMAALQWRSADSSLFFLADDDGLDFFRADCLAYARGDYSGGLLFLG